MFARDIERIDDTIKRLDESPLGACAGSGTSFNIDRFHTSKKLGFKKPTRNSIDSVSDRDYVADSIYTCSIIMMHLSRFCEDLILWNSAEFNFIKIGDSFTTGSNNATKEKTRYIRADKVMHLVYGNLISILTNLKVCR